MSGLPAHFSAMARNNRWANHRLLGACARLDGAAFTASRTSFFPSIAATLSHLYFVDLYYLDALEDGVVDADLLRRNGDVERRRSLAEVVLAYRVATCDREGNRQLEHSARAHVSSWLQARCAGERMRCEWEQGCGGDGCRD